MMNKKGNIVVFFVIMGIVLFLFGSLIYEQIFSFASYDQACIDIGMKGGNYALTIFEDSYCIDNNNIAHKIIFQCEGYGKNNKCTANLVSVK